MVDIQIKADDLDGDHYAETVEFYDLDGRHLTIDLADTNRGLLETALDDARKSLAKYVDAARPAGGKRKRNTSAARKRNSAGNSETAKIREWGKSNGWDVPDRGPLARELREAYLGAHNKGKNDGEEPPVDQGL